jgi:hypothetical protein
MNFNVTSEIVRNDAETFIPITCQENAGMTGPIHAIVWLMLNETYKAEGEFNRSLQACTYGEFNVRNEVYYFILYIYNLVYLLIGRYSCRYHRRTWIQVGFCITEKTDF